MQNRFYILLLVKEKLRLHKLIAFVYKRYFKQKLKKKSCYFCKFNEINFTWNAALSTVD